MTRIAAVSGAFPQHCYAQEEVTDALAAACPPSRNGRGILERLHSAAGVTKRHLALPLDRYGTLTGFGEANDIFIDTALDLGERVIGSALEEAGLRAADVDMVISTSVTGIAAPSLEARLAGRLGLRPDLKRLPIFGLGCVAGAAGIARMHDYLRGHPRDVAVLLCTELCSLTWQRGDTTTAGLVAAGLFGDGSAAVVAVGGEHGHGGPSVVATRTRLYPGTERVLGWDVRDSGFHIVLGRDLPELVRLHVGEEVRDFLAAHDLKPEDVTGWVCHPGGPKVLDALEESLGLPATALETSRRSLAEVGNMSSASVPHILRDTLALRPPPGTPGLVLGLGPGLCSELVLLRW
jgi:alkylresorcinol/alkylpyrone synthase